jgi:hypothetical protein
VFVRHGGQNLAHPRPSALRPGICLTPPDPGSARAPAPRDGRQQRCAGRSSGEWAWWARPAYVGSLPLPAAFTVCRRQRPARLSLGAPMQGFVIHPHRKRRGASGDFSDDGSVLLQRNIGLPDLGGVGTLWSQELVHVGGASPPSPVNPPIMEPELALNQAIVAASCRSPRSNSSCLLS